MASNGPGVPAVALTEDPVDKHGASKPGIDARFDDKVDKTSSTDSVGNEDEEPVAPDQFDPKYETSRAEIYAYYAYYIGNNGLTLFNFAPTQFQNLLSEAAGDPGVIQFAGSERTIESVVLLCNGISFAIQCVLFLIIGSYAGEFTPRSHFREFCLSKERAWSIECVAL